MFKSRRSFKKNASIRKRLLINNLIMVLIPTAIVFILLYGQFFAIIQNNTLDSQQKSAMQVSGSIGDSIEKMQTASRAITLGYGYLLMDSGSMDDEALLVELQSLKALINSYLDQQAATNIVIYGDADYRRLNTLIRTNNGSSQEAEIFRPLSDVENTYWNGIFQSSHVNEVLCPDFYLSGAEIEKYGSAATIMKYEYKAGDASKTAYVAVYNNADKLARQLVDAMDYENALAYIINSRDSIVTGIGGKEMSAYLLSYDEIGASGEDGEFMLSEIANTEVFTSYTDIKNTDWRLVWVVPQSSIVQESSFVIYQFILIYAALVGVVFIAASFYSNNIVKRISKLKGQMESVKSERPLPMDMDLGGDEIGELADTYNFMIEQINNLTDEALNSLHELNAMKIKALRAQIDPHFLYNTLDMINWFAKAGDTASVSEAVMALSRFYRLTLNKGNLMSTVRAEIDHVSLYVKLMNMRFGGKIEYLVDVPEEMMDYQIPMIIFQPIVENAIQHGIFEKPEQSGIITIVGWEEEGSLNFIVSDDGIGMTGAQLESILSFEGSEGNLASGIGVYNTHRRLQLIYKSEDFGLSYAGEYGAGTEVTFRIPKEVPEDDSL